jgi:tripartite-type tricarboxylate transporter receptor subunit TctC
MTRKFLAALSFVAAISVCTAAQAQDWPQRPVTMVVSAAAGGPIDVFGRIMAERMGQVPAA